MEHLFICKQEVLVGQVKRVLVQVEGEGPDIFRDVGWLASRVWTVVSTVDPLSCPTLASASRMEVLDLELPWDFDGGLSRDRLAAAVEHFDEWKVVGKAYGLASGLVAVVGESV
ncbi:hypothetical protein GCM10017790_01520 [Amycolatopsis oliviviridis]|uniref:Uncharacterized protein n=1 Tax=Amycolatopsis oliviviridis TaxID=1471590 RepID=A0ABQ3L582_9PSEU|nr:hypothetical protein GCM10017790_01520 [Amycolatopsis oliviviridis]